MSLVRHEDEVVRTIKTKDMSKEELKLLKDIGKEVGRFALGVSLLVIGVTIGLLSIILTA